MDTEDRRYFKQQEITLWRKSEKTRKSLSNSAIGGLENSQSNLTQAQQNAQMPTHLVTSTAGHPGGVMVVDTNAVSQPGNHTSPASSTIVEHSNNMGLFTEEESPQHEALGSKVRSNPLEFDTDEDKTPSKEEEVPVVGGGGSKEAPKQQPSLEESSSLFDEPVVTSDQQSNNIVSNNDEVVEQKENSNATEDTITTIDDGSNN